MSILFSGFKYRYPQSFLDQLAKDLGIKWTKVEFRTVHKDLISVKPMDPPSMSLLYMDMKYNNENNEQTGQTIP